MNAKPTDIDGFFATLPDQQRETLETMRRTILSIAPDAVQSISYGVPTFKYKGRPLAYLGAAKHHCALYGVSVDLFKDDLAGYDLDKGTIRYPIGEPMPPALVKKLLDARIASIEESAAKKGKKPAAGKSG